MLVQVGIAFWLAFFTWKITWVMGMPSEVDGSRWVSVLRIGIEAVVFGFLVETICKCSDLARRDVCMIASLFLMPIASSIIPSSQTIEPLVGLLFVGSGLLGLAMILTMPNCGNRILCMTLCFAHVLLGSECLLLQELTDWHWGYYLPVTSNLIKVYFIGAAVASGYTFSKNVRPLRSPRVAGLAVCIGLHAVLWWCAAFKGF